MEKETKYITKTLLYQSDELIMLKENLKREFFGKPDVHLPNKLVLKTINKQNNELQKRLRILQNEPISISDFTHLLFATPDEATHFLIEANDESQGYDLIFLKIQESSEEEIKEFEEVTKKKQNKIYELRQQIIDLQNQIGELIEENNI